tara:strand:+ start:6009 stop:6638 length:630 start_codon:yes stop_codon:yes gene_type:complete
MKTILSILLLISCLATTSFAKTNKQWAAWVAPSSFWGQGHAGTTHKIGDKYGSFIYNYVYDWKDTEFKFHETTLKFREDNVQFGSRYRWQDNHEVSPFVGASHRWECLTFYNEIEYRFNQPIYHRDYVRTRSKIDLTFFKEEDLRPYIALDLFFNWDATEIEKTRLYVGYSMTVGNRTGTLFVIPWVDGELEENWLDKRRFGVGATINF